MTIMFDASITAAVAWRSGPTAAIFDPSISTSAFSKSPSLESIVRTTPPFKRTRCPGAPLGGTSLARPVEAQPANPAPPAALATSPVVLEPRNPRREITPASCAPASRQVASGSRIAEVSIGMASLPMAAPS